MTQQVFEQFAVTDEASLEWYVRKQAALQDEIARVKAQAESIVRDLEKDAADLEFRFGAQVRNVLFKLLDGKRRGAKSHKTLWGTVGVRTVPARLKVTRTEDLIGDLPDDLRPLVVQEKVDSATLNKVLKVVGDQVCRADSGEVVRLFGVELSPERETLYVKGARGAGEEA